MMRQTVIICFLSAMLFICNNALAAPVKMHTDSNKVEWRKFNGHSLDQYRKDKDFIYDRSIDSSEPDMSWWQRFWQRFWNWIARHLGSTNTSSPIIKFIVLVLEIIALILAIAGIIFIIFKIIGVDLIQVFTGKSKSIEIPYEESLENIHEISFDDEIERAIQNRNYRLAVRLLYLGSLKKMNDAGMIKWQINKTNSAYIHEIINTEKQQKFRKLTRKFEYIWYGDFPIEGTGFNTIHTSFQDFNSMLS